MSRNSIKRVQLIKILNPAGDMDTIQHLFEMRDGERELFLNGDFKPQNIHAEPSDFSELLYLSLKKRDMGLADAEIKAVGKSLTAYGFSRQQLVDTLLLCAHYCKKEHALNLARKLYRAAFEQCEYRTENKMKLTECVLNISRAEFVMGTPSKETVCMQEKVLSLVNEMNMTVDDALLMLYHGVEIYFCENEDRGSEIRENAINYLRQFKAEELEKEIGLLVGWHYSFSGNFTKAIAHYETIVLAVENKTNTDIATLSYPSILFAYLFAGEYTKALVHNEILYKNALAESNYLGAIMLYAMLGRTHVYLNNFELAEEILYKAYAEALQENYAVGKYYALFGLVYLYMKMDNPEGAYSSLEKAFQVAEEASLGKTNGSPFFYDLIKNAELEGRTLSFEPTYEELIYRDYEQPNIHLAGVCARHIAELLQQKGADGKEIEFYYKKSIEKLEVTGNNLELAKTCISFAKYYLKNRPAEAKVYAQRAYDIYGDSEKEGLPTELVHLINTRTARVDFVNLLSTLYLELEHIISKEKMVSRLMASLSRYIRTESSMFVSFLEKSGRTVIYSQNIDETDTDRYQNVMGIISNTAETKEPFVYFNDISGKKYDYKGLKQKPKCVLCIPVTENNVIKAVMYFDSYYREMALTGEELQAIHDFTEAIRKHLIAILDSEYREVTDEESNLLAGDDYANSDQDSYNSVDEEINMLQEYIKKIAPTAVPVLITGETGVGKEVFAKDIFKRSNYTRHFIKVNCGAIPATLIESELFGYERGSFTGADKRKKGYFEAAEGGTVFLDEVGELPLLAQVKLLRVLQEGELMRVGGVESVKVNCRIIAATNRNLQEEVSRGTFREDLYYRLNVLQIEIPPLRKRKGDIASLANYFITKFSKELGKPKKFLSQEATMWMLEYDWPGNVRELENTLHRAVILSDKNSIELKDFAAYNAKNPVRVKTLEEVEREHILSVLDMCKGKLYGPDGAAELLGIKRTTLIARMEKLGIRKKDTEQN